jgi:hypothetical protein
VEAGRLPDPLNKEQWTFSYQYAAVPFELELGLEDIQSRVTADSLVEARLEPERLSIDLTTVFKIERGGVFRLELDVPEGFDVRQVRGREVQTSQPGKGATIPAAEIDTHRLEGPKKTHLVVNLARKATSSVGLAIELQKELKEAALLSPGKPADVPLAIPVVTPSTVERATGRLLISAPESLTVRSQKAEGLRGISFKQALTGIPAVAGGDAGAGQTAAAPAASTPALSRAAVRPVLAFAFTQEPASLRLSAERRKPQVTMRQLLVARIEEGVIKYQATFEYNVLYSGVKTLRIDVPADVSPDLRNNTRTIYDKPLDPPQPGLEKGMVAWQFSGDSELIGRGEIDLTWEKKIEKLDVGKSLDLVVPRLVPYQADHAWGQVVLAKAETLDVYESGEPKGLQPKDPQHDLVTKVAGAARAFEFHGDWKLAIKVTRYELEEVKRTSIDRAVARMVMTRAGEISVQALYRMRSAHQRLTVSLPQKAAFDREPLWINGQAVALERGQQGEFFIPLTASSADEPFLLELRYTVPGQTGQFDLPAFPEDEAQKTDVAMQKVFLCAFVPETQTLLGTVGPWTEEFHWRLGESLHWSPVCASDHKRLYEWVREGVQGPGAAADSFPTDGRLYVFSALRPSAPPDGSLRVVTMHRRTLSALLFGLIVLGGLFLVRAPLAARAMAVGALTVALTLVGVFLPTFAFQVLNGTLALAVAIVIVLWGMVMLTRLRAAAASSAQRPEASPAPPPPPPAIQPPPAAIPADRPVQNEGGPSHE